LKGIVDFLADEIAVFVRVSLVELLRERSGELPRDSTIAAVCSGGKRSGLAASLLQREGFERILHVADGGVGTWEREGRPIVQGP
jgi:hydroxyacylglutathione hydrolase